MTGCRPLSIEHPDILGTELVLIRRQGAPPHAFQSVRQPFLFRLLPEVVPIDVALVQRHHSAGPFAVGRGPPEDKRPQPVQDQVLETNYPDFRILNLDLNHAFPRTGQAAVRHFNSEIEFFAIPVPLALAFCESKIPQDRAELLPLGRSRSRTVLSSGEDTQLIPPWPQLDEFPCRKRARGRTRQS